MQMLEDLPIEAIPTAEATKLQRLHSTIQLSCMREWPKEFLQSETSTPEFNSVISEIAEFETMRLGFLHMTKETIQSVYDNLTNPDRIAPKNYQPKIIPFLGTQPALTWIQYELHREPHLRAMLRCRGGMKGTPKSPSQGTPGSKGRGARSPGGEGRQMGGSHGNEVAIHHTPPHRGGRGRGLGSRAAEHKRPTLVHSGTQETLDDNERSASLKAIQEAHRIMMIQHCLQSWEDSERIIGYGPPLTAATQTTHRSAGPTQQTETAPGPPSTPPKLTTTVRKLNMEHSQLDIHLAKERDPEQNRTEAKGGLRPHPRAQAPTQGWEQGKVNDRQKTRTTDPQLGTPMQGAKSRGKSQKPRDSNSTGPPLQTEAHVGTTRSKQIAPKPYLPDGSSYRSDDTLTNGATGLSSEKEEIKPSIKTEETQNSLPPAETVLNHKPDQTERIAATGIEPPQAQLSNTESERVPLLGSTAQGLDGP